MWTCKWWMNLVTYIVLSFNHVLLICCLNFLTILSYINTCVDYTIITTFELYNSEYIIYTQSYIRYTLTTQMFASINFLTTLYTYWIYTSYSSCSMLLLTTTHSTCLCFYTLFIYLFILIHNTSLFCN